MALPEEKARCRNTASTFTLKVAKQSGVLSETLPCRCFFFLKSCLFRKSQRKLDLLAGSPTAKRHRFYRLFRAKSELYSHSRRHLQAHRLKMFTSARKKGGMAQTDPFEITGHHGHFERKQGRCKKRRSRLFSKSRSNPKSRGTF